MGDTPADQDNRYMCADCGMIVVKEQNHRCVTPTPPPSEPPRAEDIARAVAEQAEMDDRLEYRIDFGEVCANRAMLAALEWSKEVHNRDGVGELNPQQAINARIAELRKEMK